jgi:uncharacterized DUF497 family protein
MSLGKVEGFDWDQGNVGKILKRPELTLKAIEAVFHGKFHYGPDSKHSAGEERQFAVSMEPGTRRIFLIFTIRTVEGARKIRVLSARYMHRQEVEYYEKEIAKTENRR